jgi:hypothetical protein
VPPPMSPPAVVLSSGRGQGLLGASESVPCPGFTKRTTIRNSYFFSSARAPAAPRGLRSLAREAGLVMEQLT